MPQSIAVIGIMYTKGDHIEYLKHRIEDRGHKFIVIDMVFNDPPYAEATLKLFDEMMSK
jgi:uncharacterized protein (UPF0261 family)